MHQSESTPSPAKQARDTAASRPTNYRRASLLATVSGLLALLCFLATPFLPVKQVQSTLHWPQQGTLDSVTAPLMAYSPVSLDAEVPCSLVADVPDEGGILVSTVPAQGEEAQIRGLFIRATEDHVEVTTRGRVVVAADREKVAAGDCSVIRAHVDGEGIDAAFVGMEGEPDAARVVPGPDWRPTFTGVYTDLPATALPQADGLQVSTEIDSRFTSSPTAIKWLVMILGVLSTVVALIALHRLDQTDGRASLRVLPRNLFRFTIVDGVVAGVLLLWHIIGANTSDDGYILSMARVADGADYMANYYRWYGVPESPFGSPYYDMLGLISHVSTSSMWMRLPALLAGFLCWLLLSKEVIPRLGRAARTTPVVSWTAATVFLAFWTAFNNGLRPEPVIAFGALLTWVSVERAVATRRLLPFAVACLIGAFSLATGPTGLMAVAALLAGARPVVAAVVARRHALGTTLPVVAPVLAAGTLVMVAVFWDQTLRSVLEAIRVRGAIGPSLTWYEEFIRYYALMIQTVDGSLSRRLPVLLMLLALVVVIGMVLARTRVPGAAKGPTIRLVIVIVGTMFFLMFSPTKWTHHFGVYAGIGAAIAGLAALAIHRVALQSARNRTLFLSVTLFVLAIAASGINGWWYVSSYGIPWWDRPPSFRGIEASTVLLALAVITLGIAAFQHLRFDYTTQHTPATSTGRDRVRDLSAAPIAVVAGLLVLFNIASLAKGAVAQWPAYSVAQGNLRSISGDGCMLASQVLVEPDVNKGVLEPVRPGQSQTEALEGEHMRGFEPDGVADDLTADAVMTVAGVAGSDEGPNSDRTDSSTGDTKENPSLKEGQSAGTQGGRAETAGVNGSTVALPFGLDPQTTPVLGSNYVGPQRDSFLRTDWYQLPAETEKNPLLVMSVAGRIAHTDLVGTFKYGQDLVFQFGTVQPDGSVTPVGEDVMPMDIGPNPAWRNIRVPRTAFPEGADAVRVQVHDGDLNPDQWVAVTPPRMPELETLQDYVGSEDPVLLDWATALQFPCQRPFGHYGGVAEVPKFRVLPDRPLAVSSTDTWQSYEAGGVLGWAEIGLDAQTVPSYLRDDWNRDWGSLERYTPYGTYPGDPVPAQIEHTTSTRWGWWEPSAEIFVTNPQ